MNKIQELKSLIKSAVRVDSNSKFTADQGCAAAVNAIIAHYGLENASSRDIRLKQPAVFALVEEVVEEMLPKEIENIIGGFAEVKTFERDAEPVFKINKVGKNRIHNAIVPGARGGVYKAKRLDAKTLTVDTDVETVAVYVTLEDILLGNYSIADLMEIVRAGFIQRVYTKTVAALRTAKTLAPAANRATGSGFVEAEFDDLVRIAKAYGNPVIMGFRNAIAKLGNGVAWATNTMTANADLDDVRAKGFVTMYKGVPVVELDNFALDTNNVEFAFKEGDIFILPTELKPVKVAMRGDLTIQEITMPTGAVQQQAHRLMGVALDMTNAVCVYTDTAVVDTYNKY